MKPLFYLLVTIIFFSEPKQVLGQQRLSIEECYRLARQNYPLLKQADLIVKTATYSIENASTGYLPQFSIIGQASYQSDVTRIPIEIPGINISEPGKDQYRLVAEGSQILFDGGLIKQSLYSVLPSPMK